MRWTICALCALGLAGCVVDGDFVPFETAPRDATCRDGAINGGESDVDCGGPCSPCSLGRTCVSHADCGTGFCDNGICAPASCGDGVADGGESDVDCGGPCAGCADGSICNEGGDCASGVCTEGVCAAATCTDGVHNGTEVDVDCAGGCPPCGEGMACTAHADCAGGACVGGVCIATCTDEVANQAETDVDCGGPLCPACADGASCLYASDCASHVCAGSACEPATCADGVESGLETDVDCGGPECTPCDNGLSCHFAEDCLSGGCTQSVCAAWAKGFGHHVSWAQRPVLLSTDATGDIAFVSMYEASTDFGGGMVTGFPVFLAKLSRIGVHRWSRSIAQAQPFGIASDATGNVYVGTAQFGGDMGCGFENDEGGGDAVIVKYDSATGACLWQKRFFTANSDLVQRIAVAPNGEVAITGRFGSGTFQMGSFSFTNNHPPSAGVYRQFVAKLDPAGTVLWAKDVGDVWYGDWTYEQLALALDPSGNTIVAREMINDVTPGTVDFGAPCAPLDPTAFSDVFIAKLDGAGTCLWANTYPSTGYDFTKNVATDSSGNIFFVGHAGAPIDFGGGPVSGGANGLFLAKLTGTGAHVWSRGFDVAGAHSNRVELATDAAGNAIMVGTFSFYADFGNGYVNNASTVTSCYACPDLFIAKYAAATGNHLFSTTHGVDADDIASDVAINPVTGSAIVTGSYQLALDVGAPQTLLPVSARNAFVLSLGPLP